jgi:hypothetical protein
MKRFFGGLLVAIGILIAGLSGLCSLAFAGLSLFDGGRVHVLDIVPIVTSALAFGGIPFAIGVGCILGGRALLKQP